MGGVDIADQLQSTYVLNWLPLFFWVLDHAIINVSRVGIHLFSPAFCSAANTSDKSAAGWILDDKGRKYWKEKEPQEFCESLYVGPDGIRHGSRHSVAVVGFLYSRLLLDLSFSSDCFSRLL